MLSDALAVRTLASGPEPIGTRGEDGGSGIGAVESGTDGQAHGGDAGEPGACHDLLPSRVLSRPGQDPTNDLSRQVRRQRPGCGGGRRRRLCRDASKPPRSIRHVPVNCTYESHTYCA
jgi:hypothetical protein